MQISGYTIIKELGRGGMATVYLAVQQSLDREVALKVMSPHLLADESFSSRFLREAKIVAKLSHPNVIPIYDVATSEAHLYIAMEYESAGDLKQRIKKGIDFAESIAVMQQIASALQFAHGNGYIHRDVKPENILFNAHGKALLTDFGVARAYDSSTDITAVGAVIGTPLYMSPEQVQGKAIDHRSDLYSLGAVFFEMISGAPPYRGDSAVTVAVKHMTDPVPSLPQEYAALQPFFEKLLNKNASHRFQSAAEITAQMAQFELGKSGASLLGNTPAECFADDATGQATVVLPRKAAATAASPGKFKALTVLAGVTLLGVLATVLVVYRQQPVEPMGAQTPGSVPLASDKHNSETHQQGIADLLLQARQDMTDGRLTQPSGNNGYEKYLAVLKLDAGNAEADQGMRAIGEYYLSQMDKALQAKQFDDAQQFYQQVQRVYPQYPDLQNRQATIKQARIELEEQAKQHAAERRKAEQLRHAEDIKRQQVQVQEREEEQQRLEENKRRKVQEKLAVTQREKELQEETRRAELAKQVQLEAQQVLKHKQEQQAKLNQLLTLATNLLVQNKPDLNAVDQAYKYYADIRAIDPQSPALKIGMASVVNTYADLAENALDNRTYDDAHSIVQKALAIDKGNARLLKIREAIQEAQKAGSRVFGGF